MNYTANVYRFGYLLTAILFGVIITVIKYQGYGVADHVEQLPLIYRALDSSYLISDFFVNSASTSVTRFGYSELLAALAGKKENLPLVFFLVTMTVNVSISTITYLFASKLYNSSPLSGVYASAATMLSVTFSQGWNAEIFYNMLMPAAITTPLLMGAVWATLDKRIVTSTVLCIVATIFHPLMGLEAGFLLLFTFIVVAIYEKRLCSQYLASLFLSFLLLVLAITLILYLEKTGPRLSSDQFIYILAYLRHPHHYLPSTFKIENYYYAAAFLLSATIAFVSRRVSNAGYDNGIAFFSIAILLLCIGGYLFVEVFPSRLWTTAQTFRLLYFLKWLGLVVFAGNIPTYKFRGWKQLALLFATANAIVMFCSQIIIALTSRVKSSGTTGILTDLAIVTIIVVLMGLIHPLLQLLPWVVFLLLILLAANYYPRFIKLSVLPVLLVTIVLMLTSRSLRTYLTTKKDAYNTKISNYFRLDRKSYFASSEIIMYIRKKTEEDAIFMTPPMWGEVRLFAGRSIVVDFKAFPFQDNAMKEWYERLVNCYGVPQQSGFNVVGDYNDNYRVINDEKLLDLKHRYNFSYAVLYINTPTGFEVMSADDKFKLVRMPQ